METALPPHVRLTRKVTFSSGHRYWIPALSAEENRQLFGQWASPYNHGHNYVLEVTTEGAIDPVTGMVVNIKDIDDILESVVVARFNQKSINDEIEHFHSRSSSTENLLLYIGSLLGVGVLPPQTRLTGIRLYEMDTLFGDYFERNGTWIMTLTRVYEFAASHRLHAPQLSDAENASMFGKCNNPAGHGHNYTLEVTVEGEPDPRTGMMVDLGRLDKTGDDLVVERYDHKHLNVDLPEFQNIAPTSEVIAAEIFKRLDGQVPGKLNRIRLYETARSYFEIAR